MPGPFDTQREIGAREARIKLEHTINQMQQQFEATNNALIGANEALRTTSEEPKLLELTKML